MLLAVPAPAAFLTQQTNQQKNSKNKGETEKQKKTNQQKRNRKDKKETIFVGIEND